MTSVAIIGAAGKMGQALVRCVLNSTDLRLVLAVEQPGSPELGRDAGEVAVSTPADLAITAAFDDLGKADVIVDFSARSATAQNAHLAATHSRPIVIGTTGVDKDQADRVYESSRRIPIVWAPNMSLGVNLLFATVERAAQVLGSGYSVQVDETHHVHKKDAPSGTALRLGERIAEGRGQDFRKVMIHNPEGQTASPDQIVIRSHREGEVVGEHAVVFSNAAEKISFSHSATSRDALALGALHAARWVLNKRPGLYDMQDVLSLRQ